MKKNLFLLFLFFNGLMAFAQNSDRDQAIQNDFQNYVNTESARNYTGSFLPVFTSKENTLGNRYLFVRWVKGKVFNLDSQLISDDSFVFNYDKITKKLLATQDNKTVVEVNDEDMKSFTLTYGDVSVTFERIPLISNEGFYVLLAESGKKYSLYKRIKTRFQRTNFTTNGIFQSGNNYDEFIDEPDYYIVMPGQKEAKKLELTRKSVKAMFKPEISKVRSYFTDHSGEAFDEVYLTGLVNFLNK
jgi:hypothetical protein